MEFGKMVTITLYRRQQKIHWCIEQSFGLCGRGRGQDDLGEWHWNMYNIIYKTNRQSRFNAWYWMLGAGALGRPRGTGREEGGGFRTGNTCLPEVDSCCYMAKPIQYCKVKKKKKKTLTFLGLYGTTPLPFECCMVMTNFPAASWFSISAVYLETSGKL